jgi:DNA primase
MGYISDKSVQEIYDAAKIDEVVSDYVHLKRRGINLIGNCPFHNEKTPSFNVSPAKGIFKCFGCGEGGNAVNFVMKIEQLSYSEALRRIAKKYNIELEEIAPSTEDLEKQQVADSLYIVNGFAQSYYLEQLFESDHGKSVGLQYFKERGLREETIKRFGLGYAHGVESDFIQNALKKGYEGNLLIKAGLSSTGGKDFYRQRVMFPIHNLSGKVIGFGGRTLSSDKKTPKYINTPESEIYHKSKILYGIHQAKKAILTDNRCYLVEGYMDVLTLSQGGIENVVASSGTALTPGQIQLIKRFSPNITILYDGDAAGIKAALRGLDLVLEQDMNVKVALIPDGEDPDSYLQKVGITAFRAFLEKEAVDFVLFKTRLLLSDAKNDPIKKAELVKDLVDTIAIIPDPLKRAVFVRDCSNLMDVQEQILHNEINKRIVQQQKKDKNVQEEQKNPTDEKSETTIQKTENEEFSNPVFSQKSKLEFQEKDIARILIQFGHKTFKETETVAEYVLTNMAEIMDEFENPTYAKIVEIYIEYLSSGKSINTDYFINHADTEISKLAINLISSPYEYSEKWAKMNVYLHSQKMPDENHIADAVSGIQHFKLRKIERLMRKNQKEIQTIQEKKGDFEELLILLKVQSKLIEMRTEIAKLVNTVVLK